MKRIRRYGFSLAELLIVLAILGIVSVFTVPKILQTPNSTLERKQTEMAKNVGFMILSAYEKYKNSVGTVPGNATPSVLIPYLNYVSMDTSSYVDAHPNWVGLAGNGRLQCSASTPCLNLHNGGRLLLRSELAFGGTTSLNCFEITFDPDRTTSGSLADSPTKSLQVALYYDGYLKTRGQVRPGSWTSGGYGVSPDSSFDPSWFSGF